MVATQLCSGTLKKVMGMLKMSKKDMT